MCGGLRIIWRIASVVISTEAQAEAMIYTFANTVGRMGALDDF